MRPEDLRREIADLESQREERAEVAQDDAIAVHHQDPAGATLDLQTAEAVHDPVTQPGEALADLNRPAAALGELPHARGWLTGAHDVQGPAPRRSLVLEPRAQEQQRARLERATERTSEVRAHHDVDGRHATRNSSPRELTAPGEDHQTPAERRSTPG